MNLFIYLLKVSAYLQVNVIGVEAGQGSVVNQGL
jgi:hypothetical protein